MLQAKLKQMDSRDSSKFCVAKSSSNLASKRLLFDRRYGWVFDDWKHPSEEALAGGRGMFCVLPLGKAILKTASQTMNLAATSAVKVFEKTDLLSPQLLQASLNDQLQRFMPSTQKPEFNFFALKENSSSHATNGSSYVHVESRESQMV